MNWRYHGMSSVTKSKKAEEKDSKFLSFAFHASFFKSFILSFGFILCYQNCFHDADIKEAHKENEFVSLAQLDECEKFLRMGVK